MPTYDYKCRKCGKIVEATVRYEDRDLYLSHTECKGEMVRIPSMPGLAGFGKHGRSL
jgi:putative FmdB family regulatory protein